MHYSYQRTYGTLCSFSVMHARRSIDLSDAVLASSAQGLRAGHFLNRSRL